MRSLMGDPYRKLRHQRATSSIQRIVLKQSTSSHMAKEQKNLACLSLGTGAGEGE